MRPLALLALALVICATDANAAKGKVLKVLPHLVDEQGRHTLHPSLYERDAYQDHLRKHPEKCAALRFDIHWKAEKVAFPGLRLRLEARGSKAPRPVLLETALERRPWYKRWSSLRLEGEEFRQLGELVAWRASLWEGDTLVAELKSFLW